MATKYEKFLEERYAVTSRIFEAEAAQPQTPAVEEVSAPAQTAPPPIEFTPTEEQILTALVQKIGAEQLIAKVNQLAQTAAPQPAAETTPTPAPATKPATPPTPAA